MKNCLNSKDPSCARQEPRKVSSVTKLRKPFRKPFTAFSSQRGPFRRPRITTTARSPVTFDSNKTENDDECAAKISDHIQLQHKSYILICERLYAYIFKASSYFFLRWS